MRVATGADERDSSKPLSILIMNVGHVTFPQDLEVTDDVKVRENAGSGVYERERVKSSNV